MMSLFGYCTILFHISVVHNFHIFHTFDLNHELLTAISCHDLTCTCQDEACLYGTLLRVSLNRKLCFMKDFCEENVWKSYPSKLWHRTVYAVLCPGRIVDECIAKGLGQKCLPQWIILESESALCPWFCKLGNNGGCWRICFCKQLCLCRILLCQQWSVSSFSACPLTISSLRRLTELPTLSTSLCASIIPLWMTS